MHTQANIPRAKGLPVIGSTLEFMNRPLQLLTQNASLHDGMYQFKLGSIPVYVLNDPDEVHQVLVKDASKYHKAKATKQAVAPLLGNGLTTSDGEFWKKQRKLAAPAFHHRRISNYADVMVQYTQDMIASWQTNGVHDIEAEMTALTLRIVTKTLFDSDVSEDVRAIGESMTVLQDILAKRFRSPLSAPEWLPTAINRIAKEALKELDTVVARIIQERRLEPTDHGDLLSMLILSTDDDGNPMSDQQLRDEVITLFVAGHETTAKLLTWIFYALNQNPEVEAQLAGEIAYVLEGHKPTLADLSQLPYTNMVIKEALRMYPPAWLMTREPQEEVMIGQYTIPKDSLIFISPYALHHNPKFFTEPELFLPERFANPTLYPFPQNAYIPFGTGPRICIGNSFAMMEAGLILASIIQQFQLNMIDKSPIQPVPMLTLVPGRRMMMQVTQRELEAELFY